jgi:hypothetical protein
MRVDAHMTYAKAAFALLLAACLVAPALAGDEALRRVLACEGPDAKMEVYIPETAWSGIGVDNAALAKPVAGLYALDLSGAGKGKWLEPVRVSLVDGGATLVVDQFTRGLPPTRIPVEGGVVDFDQRFGTEAKCGPFNE